MYEKFTDLSRKIMVEANREAQNYDSEFLKTEHLLLGITKVECCARIILAKLGIDRDKILQEVQFVIPKLQVKTAETTYKKLQQSTDTKIVLNNAIEEANKFANGYVRTEFLLFGLLKESACVAAQVLVNLGLTQEMVQAEIEGKEDVTLVTSSDIDACEKLKEIAFALFSYHLHSKKNSEEVLEEIRKIVS